MALYRSSKPSKKVWPNCGSSTVKQALKPDAAAFWRSPELTIETITQVDVVIITGSALVEGGLDDLLVTAGHARAVVLAGPTASPWPPPFFERGVHVLGGIHILDQCKLLQVVSEGGSGYFFEKEAEKRCLVHHSLVETIH